MIRRDVRDLSPGSGAEGAIAPLSPGSALPPVHASPGAAPPRRLPPPAAALAILLLCASIAACGFHLRGAVTLPEAMARTELRGVAEGSALAAEIGAVLAQSGGDLVTAAGAPTSTLEVLGERSERRVASVDSAGKVNQYELRYELRARLVDEGVVLVPEQSVSASRLLDFNGNAVLGAADEEEMLRREMRGQAVRQLIRQLRMALARNGRTGSAAP